MRKLFILLTAGLLVLAVAAPATSAPEPGKNKWVDTWEIDCSTSNAPNLGVFTVHAKGVPGWPTDPWAATPVHFRAASDVQIWEGGAMVEDWGGFPPPRGLADSPKMVGPCFMHLYEGDTDEFDILFYDAYYFFPTPVE